MINLTLRGCCRSGPKDRGLWPVGESSLGGALGSFQREKWPKWPKWPNVSLGSCGGGIPGPNQR